jgi:hypothetical protein
MSLAIDPKAGTHFTGKIFVTPHALDRVVEHFGITRSQAPVFVMDNLRKASLVSANVISDKGDSARMFAYRRMLFIVDLTEATVITVHPQHEASESIRNPIERIIQRAVKSAERHEQREIKRLTVRKGELHVERAECDLRRIKSESIRVISDMSDKISGIDAEIQRIEREVFEVKREKKTIMKSVAAYI